MAKTKPSEDLVDVAVMAAIRWPLTYRVPQALDVQAGQRVQVPLGPRRATGIVLEPRTRVAPGFRLREILRVLEPEPLLNPELLTLGLWIAEYYLAPVGEVFRAMLPLRANTRLIRLVQLTARGRQKLAEFEGNLLDEARESPEARLLRYLAQHDSNHDGPGSPAGAPLGAIRSKFQGSFSELMARAQSEGWVNTSELEGERGQRTVLAVRLADAPSHPALQGPVPERVHKLSPVARRIVEALEREGATEDHRELLKSTRANLGHLRKLADAGLVQVSEAKLRPAALRAAAASPLGPYTPPPLSAAQTGVVEELGARLASAEFSVALLHGVTGSGKTEIYLRLIARCLELGRTALMLVPEIALTPAVELQVVERFGERVAVLHSSLGETERHQAWWRIRRHEATVVLGTRSAVFAPLENLGVVVVDEEHEPSYKQDETPRYHGRDVAVVRARLAGALAVLGSATPSLESYWNVRQGKYRLCTLNERIGGRPLASVEVIDMRQEFRQTQFQVPISRRLEEEMRAALALRAQTMILLNRRGYSWFLLCRSCGQSQRCINCSISLTYHRRAHRLMCHYCGYTTEVPIRCPSCSSEYLQYVGEGTEKIEAKLAELFPGARVERLDRDAARRRGHFRKVLSDFRQGKIDVLVGTQLIAKGHDFPGVTLVGAVSADIGLGLPDFRAAERTFQLLTQAAGRAGRGDAPGRVLVQTFFPEHYAIRLAAAQNYEGFFVKEMSFRRLMHYPPSAALANVIAQHTKLEQAARIAKQVGDYFEGLEGDSRSLRILGPSPAPLARIQGRYRIQFLLKATSRARLNQVLRRLVDYCEEQKISPQNVMIDMDPVSVM